MIMQLRVGMALEPAKKLPVDETRRSKISAAIR
jgi:hypothetical protein